MKSPPNAVLIVALVGVLAGGGCAQFSTRRPTLPATHTVVRDQLVVHSEFPLAASHRLLEELAARRFDLAHRLGLPVSEEPIHVYLFDDANQFDNFIHLHYPGFPPRRAYFLETDTRLHVYAQWGDRVAEDLRHEVTHGYLHSVVPNLPLWLDEGLAEYFEVPRGAHGLNPPHLAELVSQMETGGRQPDLKRLEGFERPFDMTQADYAEAWAWVHFFLESGPESRRALEQYLLDLRRDGTAEPVSERIGRHVAAPELALADHLRSLQAGAGLAAR
ncbi:MAG: hypothetical protein ABIP48_29830 [Planctomycetota bacterium]